MDFDDLPFFRFSFGFDQKGDGRFLWETDTEDTSKSDSSTVEFTFDTNEIDSVFPFIEPIFDFHNRHTWFDSHHSHHDDRDDDHDDDRYDHDDDHDDDRYDHDDDRHDRHDFDDFDDFIDRYLVKTEFAGEDTIFAEDTISIPTMPSLTISDFTYKLDDTGLTFVNDAVIDADKSLVNSNDDNMCWAAVCANMLTQTGLSAQSATESLAQEDATFAYFVENYKNDGNYLQDGMLAYFKDNGINTNSVQYGTITNADEGDMLDAIAAKLDAGFAVGLEVYSGWFGHAVTCLGLVSNKDGYTGVVLTDSDDAEIPYGQDLSTVEVPDTLRIVAVDAITRGPNAGSYELDGYGVVETAFYLQGVEDTTDDTPVA